MSNHLIIGLGGTGGKIVREFRKRIYEEFGSNDPGNKVKVDYIYLDSSLADLNDRSSWKVMGRPVHLPPTRLVSTHGINDDLLTNTRKYPGVEAFLKPSEIEMLQQDSNMVQLINSGIGGQRRRLGRMLIANHMSNKNTTSQSFAGALSAAMANLQQGNDDDVTFHICAGLAGGTGSGSIVDVISQIRTLYPSTRTATDEPTFKIRLFVYMPERNLAHVDHDAGFYQANGYAALMELNAMSVGTYHPIDVTGQIDVITEKVRRLLQDKSPFETCYIYSNVNEAGKNLRIGTDLPVVVANFLFQTIIVPSIVGSNGKLARLVGCENKGVGAEEDKSGRKAHSRQFLSFGITRVSYPESEVHEYATYHYARQAALQLAYGYWVEGQGYSERPLDEVGSGYHAEVAKAENRGRYLLDNNHLILSEYIIKDDSSEQWKHLDQTWNAHSDAIAREVVRNFADKKKEWVREYSVRMREVFDTKFRDRGVSRFYEDQREKEISRQAGYIGRHIEGTFFNDWKNGDRSVLEIGKYIELLIENCGERIAEFNSQRTKLTNTTLPEHQRKVAAVRDDYDHIGWLKDAVTGASQKIFNQYQSALKEYYYTSTLAEAYDYAALLLGKVVSELMLIQERVKDFGDRLERLTKEATEQAAAKCQLNEAANDAIVKKYDPKKVQDIVHQYTINKKYQSESAKKIREDMVAALGEGGETTFGNLNKKVEYGDMLDAILNDCSSAAKDAMKNTADKDASNRMIGVSILEKLKQELTTPEQFEQFVKQTIDKAKTYVQFNNSESSTGEVMDQMLQVCIPKADSTTEDFRAKLIQAFKDYSPGYNFNESDCVAEHYRPNEIIVVTARSGFPLRYLDNMTTLKEKYDRLLVGPKGAFNRMLLHTESFDDFDKAFPALFNKSPEEIKKEMLPTLMLAYTLNLIEEQTNTDTGERILCLKGKDAAGRDAMLQIKGVKNFAQVWNALGQDYAMATKIKKQVEETLRIEARSNDQKTALKERLFNVLDNEVLNTLCEGNKFHTDYERYTQIVANILNNELKLM